MIEVRRSNRNFCLNSSRIENLKVRCFSAEAMLHLLFPHFLRIFSHFHEEQKEGDPRARTLKRRTRRRAYSTKSIFCEEQSSSLFFLRCKLTKKSSLLLMLTKSVLIKKTIQKVFCINEFSQDLKVKYLA